MTSVIIYMTQEHIVHVDSKRLKAVPYKNYPFTNYVSPWGAMKAKNHIRLTSAVLCVEFFIFPNRFLDFQRFHRWLDRAIDKLGQFQFVS